jgi:hypothetical protein
MKTESERISLWKESKYLPLIFTSSSADLDNIDMDEFIRFVRNYYEKNRVDREEDESLEISLFESAKEAIFDFKDDKPVIHLITYSIDASRGQIGISHILDILFEDKNDEETREDVLHTLGLANAFGVPVYPNTDKVSPILANYHRDMVHAQ